MSAYRLYDTWFHQIQKLLAAERITRVRNVVWMIVGMYLGRSVHLARMAGKLPLARIRRSTVQRFSRFLKNRRVQARRWYRPVAENLLRGAAAQGPVRLIIDSTKVGTHYQLLLVGLAYRKRALPVAWTWVKGPRGHSSAYKQRALLSYVRKLLPTGAHVLLVGDSEFGAVAVLRQLEQWGWRYVLRQKGNVKVLVSPSAKWQDFRDLIQAEGQSFWYPQAVLTAQHLHHTRLLARWQTGEDEPWLLATNLPTERETLRAYGRRMWLDELYGDLKRHGVNLEQTRLRHFQRLSRLFFLVALFYLWLVDQGSRTIKNGQRHLVDRRDRRDRSIFRIGWDWVDWLLARDKPFRIRLRPYF